MLSLDYISNEMSIRLWSHFNELSLNNHLCPFDGLHTSKMPKALMPDCWTTSRIISGSHTRDTYRRTCPKNKIQYKPSFKTKLMIKSGSWSRRDHTWKPLYPSICIKYSKLNKDLVMWWIAYNCFHSIQPSTCLKNLKVLDKG